MAVIDLQQTEMVQRTHFRSAWRLDFGRPIWMPQRTRAEDEELLSGRGLVRTPGGYKGLHQLSLSLSQTGIGHRERRYRDSRSNHSSSHEHLLSVTAPIMHVMSNVVLAPYLPLREAARVGPWALVPFKALADADALPAEHRRPVMRLVEAYAVPSGGGQVLGAVLYPAGAAIGSHFERSDVEPLRRALLAGVIASNPYMAVDEEHQDPNAGHAIGTAENAIVWSHPIDHGDSYVIETGMLVRAMSYNRAEPGDPLPPVAPPVELPSNLFGGFDHEVADATHAVITSTGVAGRRLRRALDWYLIAYSNAEAVTTDVRIAAARSAVEVMTGAGDQSKKIVRALGSLLGDETTPRKSRRSAVWTKKGAQVPVQLTRDEWWMARLCELRNAIAHGDEIPDALWMHERHHQINHVHDRLIDCLLATLAGQSGDALLRLRGSDRMFARRSDELADRLRDLQAGETV